MFRRLCMLAACTLLGVVIHVAGHRATLHAEYKAGQDDKPFHLRLIGPQTMGFMHVRVADVMAMPVMQEMFKQMPDLKENMSKDFIKDLGVTPFDVDTVTAYLEMPQVNNGDIKEPRTPYVVLKSKKPFVKASVLKTLGSDVKELSFGAFQFHAGRNQGLCLLDDKTMLMIPFDGRHRAESAQTDLLHLFTSLTAEAEVPEALKPAVAQATTGKSYVVAGFHVTKQLSEFAQQMAANIPASLASFKPLLKVQSGMLTADFNQGGEPEYLLKFTGRFPDAGTAKAGMNSIRFAIAAAKIGMSALPNRKDPELKETFDLANKMLDGIKLETAENDVVVSTGINFGSMMPMLMAAIEKTRNAADRMVSANNIRQCIIAMHNYHNDYSRMPEAVTMSMPDKKPLHSWRVMILPYMEYDNYFKQINVNEPWDSPANKKFFESVPMPKFYAHPGKKDGDSKMTYYKVFTSKGDAKPSAGFRLGGKITLGQMTVQDGTSNTICIIEAGPPVLWYKPDDILFDANAQLPNMVSPWKDKKVNVGFFDGSVRSLFLGTDEATWKAFITVNGGETADISKIETDK